MLILNPVFGIVFTIFEDLGNKPLIPIGGGKEADERFGDEYPFIGNVSCGENTDETFDNG